VTPKSVDVVVVLHQVTLADPVCFFGGALTVVTVPAQGEM